MEFKSMVTIIIPVYNVIDYLEECVQSVLSQTYHDLEIILVDDGSTDGSGEVCDDFKQKDNRIMVVHKANGGLSSARNAGLDIASGKFISFIDGDDIIEPTFIEGLVKHIDNCRYELAIAPIKLYFSNGATRDFYKPQSSAISSHEYLIGILNHSFDNSVCNKMFLMDSIGNLRFNECIINEDFPFMISYLQRTQNVIITNESSYYYRQREGSITQCANPQLYDFIANGFDIKDKLPKEYSKEVNKYILYECINFISIVTKYNAKNKFKKEIEFTRKYIRKNIKPLIVGEIGYRQLFKLILVEVFPGLFKKLAV